MKSKIVKFLLKSLGYYDDFTELLLLHNELYTFVCNYADLRDSNNNRRFTIEYSQKEVEKSWLKLHKLNNEYSKLIAKIGVQNDKI